MNYNPCAVLVLARCGTRTAVWLGSRGHGPYGNLAAFSKGRKRRTLYLALAPNDRKRTLCESQ